MVSVNPIPMTSYCPARPLLAIIRKRRFLNIGRRGLGGLNAFYTRRQGGQYIFQMALNLPARGPVAVAQLASGSLLRRREANGNRELHQFDLRIPATIFTDFGAELTSSSMHQDSSNVFPNFKASSELFYVSHVASELRNVLYIRRSLLTFDNYDIRISINQGHIQAGSVGEDEFAGARSPKCELGRVEFFEDLVAINHSSN
jgi:hypothetical protein